MTGRERHVGTTIATPVGNEPDAALGYCSVISTLSAVAEGVALIGPLFGTWCECQAGRERAVCVRE